MSEPAEQTTAKGNTAAPHAGQQRVMDKIAERFRKRGRARTAPPAAKRPFSARRFLLRASSALVIGTYAGLAALAASTHLTGPLDNLAAQQSRGLTAGEAAMAHAVFGQDFDTASVRLRFHDHAPTHPFNNVHDDARHATLAYVNASDTRNIHMIDRVYHADDYSRANDMGVRGGVFMHELTHIWQHRAGDQAVSCKTYEYTLTPQSRFEDFCTEQQGEIIRDYTMRFLIPGHPMMEMSSRIQGMARAAGITIDDSLGANESILARVVERQFPTAAAARLRMQASFNDAAVCAFAQQQQAPQVSYQDHFNSCAATRVRTLNGETLTAQMSVPMLQTPRTTPPRPPAPRPAS